MTKTNELNLDMKFKNINAIESLPFSDNYFDVVYSHMFYNMGFADDELEFLFNESEFIRIKDNYHFLSEVTKILCIKKVQK
jgi:hypothetical protein